MPPMSHTLAEEGAAILSFKLVKGGKFQVSIIPFLHTIPSPHFWLYWDSIPAEAFQTGNS